MFSSINLPKVVADTMPGGGFTTARSGQNSLSQQNLNNRLLQAQGNLAQTQSDYTPVQYIATALSDPKLWMTDAGKAVGANLLQLMPHLLQQSASKSSGNNSINSLDTPTISGMLMSIFNKGKNAISGGNNAPSQNAVGNLSGNNDNKNAFSPTQPNQSSPGGPSTPASAAAQQNSQGFNVAPNPIDTQKTSADSQHADVVGNTNIQNTEKEKLNELINAQSSGATQALKSLEGWNTAMSKSSYKGQYAGSFPASGVGSIPTLIGGNVSPEQLADNFQADVLQATTDMQNSGAGVTDDARALLSSAKGISRVLDPEARKVTYESKKATLQRMIQSRQFLDNFWKENPRETKEHAVAMMNNYNRFAPAYDYHKFKTLPENDKLYKLYSSKEAMDSYNNTGEYIPSKKQKNDHAGYKMEFVEPTDKVTNKKTSVLAPSQEDLEYTAKNYNMTVDEVKKYLGIK